jgi:hypothetical protein
MSEPKFSFRAMDLYDFFIELKGMFLFSLSTNFSVVLEWNC